MAKSRGGLLAILVFLGALFALSGLVFTLQGLGIVGPGTSFMFKNSTWIYQGVLIFIIGLVMIIAAFMFRRKPEKAPMPADMTPSKEKS